MNIQCYKHNDFIVVYILFQMIILLSEEPWTWAEFGAFCNISSFWKNEILLLWIILVFTQIYQLTNIATIL